MPPVSLKTPQQTTVSQYKAADLVPTFHLHVTLKESLADSEQRPARDGVADGWRREEELGAGVDLWQLRGGGRGWGEGSEWNKTESKKITSFGLPYTW